MPSSPSHFSWLDSPLVRIIAISKGVYTLAESETNWTLLKDKESSCLSSTSVGLTDKCLVPLFTVWTDKTGSDEITLREPLYVFAVNVCLMAYRHSEVNDIANCLKTSCLRQLKNTIVYWQELGSYVLCFGFTTIKSSSITNKTNYTKNNKTNT